MFRASLQIWSLKPPSSRAATAQLSLFDAMRRCDPKERSKAYKAQKQFILKHSDASGKHLKAPKKLVAHHDTPSECIEIWVWNRSHIAHAKPPSFDRHHLISTVLSFLLLTLLAADRVAWKLYMQCCVEFCSGGDAPKRVRLWMRFCGVDWHWSLVIFFVPAWSEIWFGMYLSLWSFECKGEHADG